MVILADKIPGLVKDQREVIYMLEVLKGLGAKGINNLDDRITCQKTIYLAQRMQLIQPYEFNLYVHGPYSPTLSNDLYRSMVFFDELNEPNFATISLREKYDTLKGWLKEKNSKKLELIATFDWFKQAGLSETKTIEKLKEIKNATEGDIKWCHEEHRKLGL